jgi:hypothetical protein
MIWRVVLVILTLAAAGAGALRVAGLVCEPGTLLFSLEPRSGTVLRCYLNDGSVLIQNVRDVPKGRVWSRGFVYGPFECRLGVGDRKYHRKGYGRFVRVGFPLWLVFVTLAAVPTIAFIRGPLRQWRRRRRGLCVSCGYNLTGNLSGSCPECGASTRPK